MTVKDSKYSRSALGLATALTLAAAYTQPAQAQLKDRFAQLSLSQSALDNPDDSQQGLTDDQPLTPQTRGVLKARQIAELSGAIGAKITSMPFRQGQSFKSGAVLVKFDCTRQRAEAEALRHAAQSLSIKYDNISELFSAGAAGELEQNMAKADMARAKADHEVATTRLKDCAIYAPYAGTIKTRYVNIYDSPAPGAPILSIIRSTKPEITFIAPSSWLRWMKPESRFDFAVDETGQSYKAKVTRLGAAVDPVSQTIEVTARFLQNPSGVLPGMSGMAIFPKPSSNSKAQ